MTIDVHSERSAPRFTIAIPTFNRAALLKGCVTSALSQTYPDFEVVVSDNASQDDTQDVLRQFCDRRLRIVRQDANIGLIPNWNACLAAAKGDYIVILSDDDRVAPWLLQRCAEVMADGPPLPVIVTLCDLHSLSLGHVSPARRSSLYRTGVWDGTDILTEFLTGRIDVTMCSVVMRTELLRQHGGISPDYPHTADFAAWAPMLFLGPAGLVNEACATFAYHGGSETARLNVERRLEDDARMANLISSLAAELVVDTTRSDTISSHARACFAGRALISLSDYWRTGGATPELLALLWRFRSQLAQAELKAVVRFVATVLCPESIANWFRRRRPNVARLHA